MLGCSGRTPDIVATRLIPSPRQLSKHCIMREVLSSGAKREEENDDEDFNNEEDGSDMLLC